MVVLAVQFVVQAALEKAERIIESESTIVLTRRESVRLLELIENPPPIPANLILRCFQRVMETWPSFCRGQSLAGRTIE